MPNEVNLHVDTESQKLKADQNFLGWDGQKWVLPAWSQDSKMVKSGQDHLVHETLILLYLKNDFANRANFLNGDN